MRRALAEAGHGAPRSCGDRVEYHQEEANPMRKGSPFLVALFPPSRTRQLTRAVSHQGMR